MSSVCGIDLSFTGTSDNSRCMKFDGSGFPVDVAMSILDGKGTLIITRKILYLLLLLLNDHVNKTAK